VTPSRRILFASLGLVLPVAAFTAGPASAATSTAVHHKSTRHHVAAVSHKVTTHHVSHVHHVVHHTTTHHVTHKVTAS
jgi:hypothetical protein